MPKAILFGSIGVLAETSDMQRRAFNRAFADAGLDWKWSAGDYRAMLTASGGQDRVAHYAAARGETVDAATIHAAKSAHFQTMLCREPVTPRPGVAETLAASPRAGLVTTTDPKNVAAVLDALGDSIEAGRFEFIIDRTHVAASKPDPEAYLLALTRLGLTADDVVAIEDNPPGAEAAREARLPVVAFPGAMHTDHDFGPVTARVDRLSPTEPAIAA